jgi:branched-chain amino acid transport system substrate-binding protein
MFREKRGNAWAVMLLIGGFSMVFLLGPGYATAQVKPIKVGYILPRTGPFASNGKDMFDAMTMAVDEFGGKIAGRPIQVIVEDTEAKPTVGLIKARKLLVEDGCQVMTGPIFGHVNNAVSPFINEQKIPWLTLAGSPAELTLQKLTPWIIRTTFSGPQASHPFGEYAYKVMGLRRVATIGLDYAFGYDIVGGFCKTFQDAGGKVIQKIWTPMTALDLAPYLAQVDKSADALFALYSGSISLRFVKQVVEAGLKGKMAILGGMTTVDEHALRNMGDEAIGIVSSSNWSPYINTPEAKAFVDAYRKRYNLDPSYYSEMSYSLFKWLFLALQKVDGNVEDKEKLFKTIVSLKFSAPRGPLELDNYRNANQNIYIRRVDKVGGKLQNTVLHTYPNVKQNWIWPMEEYIKRPEYSRDYPPCPDCK